MSWIEGQELIRLVAERLSDWQMNRQTHIVGLTDILMMLCNYSLRIKRQSSDIDSLFLFLCSQYPPHVELVKMHDQFHNKAFKTQHEMNIISLQNAWHKLLVSVKIIKWFCFQLCFWAAFYDWNKREKYNKGPLMWLKYLVAIVRKEILFYKI